MKVYLLQYWDGHDTWTQGTYISRELADAYRDDNPEWFDGWAGTSIQELEVVEEWNIR